MRHEPRRIVVLVLGVWSLLMLVGQGLIAPHSALGDPPSDRVAPAPSAALFPSPLSQSMVSDAMGTPVPRDHRRDAGSGGARLRATSWGRLPLAFIENRGQVDAQVKFSLGPHGPPLWVTLEGLRFALLRAKGGADQALPMSPPKPVGLPLQQPAVEREGLMLAQDWLGANKEPRIEASLPLPGRYHYFLGNDPARWRTDVPSYAEVRYRDVWEGIDLKLYGNGRHLEQEFIVKVGADPRQIRVGYRGIESLEIAADGTLRIKTAFGELHESPPRLYQEIDGERVAVDGRFKLVSPTAYTFEVGPYAPQYALVIDPTLVYALVIGDLSSANAVAVDAEGNAYVTGSFEVFHPAIATPGAFQPAVRDNISNCFTGLGSFPSGDAFVMKLDPLGDPVYFTFLGGDCGDTGTGIAIDADGNAYVGGITTSHDFPTSPGAFRTQPLGGFSSFVTKLNPTGSALVYSSYLTAPIDQFAGGNLGAIVRAIAIDADGHAYVTGVTDTQNFPVTPGAFMTTFDLIWWCSRRLMGFVTKFAPDGSGLLYSTFLGGPLDPSCGDHRPEAIAVATDGHAYVTGSTTNAGFPTTPGAFQRVSPTANCSGCRQAFVTRLDPAGSALLYSTFLGGANGTFAEGRGIALDAAGNAYVTGTTNYIDFPTTPGAFQLHRLGGGTSGRPWDAFVTKLNPTGTDLVYSTYLGGNGTDSGADIAVDGAGHAYVTGVTDASDFPTTPDAFQATATPSDCLSSSTTNRCAAFATKLDPMGASLSYSTYLHGPSTNDFGNGIAVDTAGNVHVVGQTNTLCCPVVRDFPATLLLFGASGSHLFVAKFAFGPLVTQVLPSAGGDTGPVTVVLVGANFQSGAAVKLTREGQPDIVADPVSVAADGQTLAATFDLTGQALGAWDVVVTNPDGSTETLPGGFTIEQSTGAQVWVDIIGRNIILQGRPQTYTLFVGNLGNVDVVGRLVLLLPPDALWQIQSMAPPLLDEAVSSGLTFEGQFILFSRIVVPAGGTLIGATLQMTEPQVTPGAAIELFTRWLFEP